ncbi:MAG TPA: hypothetical protein VFL77_12610 [Solirubrobacterales bacterium]|nr:hypothetical protein [Solirubrobacterales bacterium]
MPLEGHYKRVNTPLRKLTKRERRAVTWGGLTSAIAILVLVVATAGSSSHPAPAPGCIRPTIAGRTGGEVQNACGARAVALCNRAAATEGPWAEAVLSDCRARRIRFRG